MLRVTEPFERHFPIKRIMDRILCVDDDPNVLSAFQRLLRNQFDVETVLGPVQGLAFVNQTEPFAVVVADMRMPVMDGIQFLAQVKRKSPDSVRIMLTGCADLHSAIDAINQGSIFRFLTKPCPPEVFVKTLESGVRQFKLATGERELLEKTLQGSVNVLAEILSMSEPDSFGRAQRLRDRMKEMGQALGLDSTWDVELAALLCHIGHVTVPRDVLERALRGGELLDAESELISRIPEVGQRLLGQIPRLETVAKIVFYQNKRFDGGGFPNDSFSGETIPLGSRALKVLIDLARLEEEGVSTELCLEQMKNTPGCYDPRMLEIAVKLFTPQSSQLGEILRTKKAIPFTELRPGDILAEDVQTKENILIVSAGYKISPMILERLRNFSKLTGVREPIFIESKVA